MKNKKIENAKLGLFVLAGVSFLVLMLYMIGRNRNILGDTFLLKAELTNVNGLVPGNNVRFKGIDVGTVKSIDLRNDSVIVVSMTVDESVKKHIRKNAVASVGTDGLMGNKLININSQRGDAPPVRKGDILASLRPVETDEMLRTLHTTNENIEKITNNLYEITVKLNSSNSLWTLLSDTVIATDLKVAVREFRRAGTNTADVTLTAREIVGTLKDGRGLAYELFTDTLLVENLATSVRELKKASTNTSELVSQLHLVIDEMKEGEGTAGLLLRDTVFRDNLLRSSQNIEQGTSRFNENMEALKQNFLFRRYFRKLEKQKHSQTQVKNEP